MGCFQWYSEYSDLLVVSYRLAKPNDLIGWVQLFAHPQVTHCPTESLEKLCIIA